MKEHSHPHRAPDFALRLKQKSRRLTGPRRAILELLEREAHPLTIREIHDSLPAKRCDLATIYRSMHMLERMGIVNRFDFGDAIARFELVRHEQHEHHHHLICTGCAKVVEVEECFPEELQARIAEGNGFVGLTHKLEFFGICPACQTR